MIGALPVEVNRCALGCARYLRDRGLTEVARTEPDRVRLVVCGRCLLVLTAQATTARRA